MYSTISCAVSCTKGEAHAGDEVTDLGEKTGHMQDAGSSAGQGKFCDEIHTYSSLLPRWHGL